jgi:hypothetical protein
MVGEASAVGNYKGGPDSKQFRPFERSAVPHYVIDNADFARAGARTEIPTIIIKAIATTRTRNQ